MIIRQEYLDRIQPFIGNYQIIIMVTEAIKAGIAFFRKTNRTSAVIRRFTALKYRNYSYSI